jgi:hypothetical protein
MDNMTVTNVKSGWSGGNLLFYDKDGSEILRFDGTNRALVMSDGASFTLPADQRGASDGLGSLMVARATFDPSANTAQRAVAAHDLGVTIPDNALVVGGFIEVLTTFTSANDSATIAISVNSANDIVTATAISAGGNIWDAGKQAIVPKANTPESTGIKLTAARAITATVAVQALTAGKATIWLYYVQGD